MKQTDKEIERIFGKKPRPIDKKAMLNGLDYSFRKEMIAFIKGFGLKETNGEYHQIYNHMDFGMHSDDQVSKLYMGIRNEVADVIMQGKEKNKISAHYIALQKANEIVKDSSISILLESK